MIKTKKQSLIVIGAFILVLLLGTTTYAFFNYTRTGTANTIKTGRIYFDASQNGVVTLSDLFPIDASGNITAQTPGVGSLSIHVTGDTNYEEGIEYLVKAINVTSSSNGKELPISIQTSYESNSGKSIGTPDNDYYTNRGGDTSIYKLLATDKIENNKDIVVGYIAPGQTGIDGNITILAYLDANNIAITDTYDGTESDNNGTTTDWVDGREVFTTEEWNSLQANGVSFQIKVEANEGVWVEGPLTGSQKLQRAIAAKEADTNVQCSNITYEEDGITYLSGTNECIDMNYVWYSGKLWRVTGIYPDGAMKLVTQNNITTIGFNARGQSDFYTDSNTTSFIYQWLNEDFYDTLYHANQFIDTSKQWNATMPDEIDVSTKLLETNMVTANVGLLNTYEYYNSYRCTGITNDETCPGTSYSTSYLNNGTYWWLITPEYNSYNANNNSVRYVANNGYANNHGAIPDGNSGVRPSIVINSELSFTGNGTNTSPYKIVGDKEEAINNTTLLSSRSSGEYVTFDNNLYRIVDTNNGITKLTKVDFIRDDSYANGVVQKKFASSVYYGKASNTHSDSYIDYYLNNTWYNSISPTYKNMLVDGTYYMGMHNDVNHYKATICKDNDLNNVTTDNCTKYTSSDTDKTWTGKVGLPRIGEMFSSQLGSEVYTPIRYMWLITPYSNTYVYTIMYGDGTPVIQANNSQYLCARPSITLKAGIKITGGSGMENDPFEISE